MKDEQAEVAAPDYGSPGAPGSAAPERHPLITADGREILLTRHRGGNRGPVMLVHCIGVSSRMYSLQTVETNLLEYLVREGYDVWLLDYRLSIDLPVCALPSSLDEVARFDFPAAVARVLAVTGAASLQVVAHGIGSQTFVMAMLSGLQGVRSAVCSQVALHLRAPWLNRLKAALRVPALLGRMRVSSLSVNTDSRSWTDRLLDWSLRFHPIEKEEACASATCRRITAFYGPLYEHDRLNAETHAALGELFGRFNMRGFAHLIRNLNTGHLVDEDGADIYLPRLERLAMPILFIHGTDNACLLPDSTRLSYEALCAANGRERYAWKGIPGYGHVDCIIGHEAAGDVYPHILDHLRATAA